MQIYKTTNILNGKIYVGQDSKDNPNYFGSGRYFKNALKKYGKENFKKEILQECETIEELNEAEIFWIAKLDAMNPNIGYNLCKGGNGSVGYKLTDEQKAKISEKLSGENNPMFGKKHSEETIKKIKDKRKDQTFSKETRQKMRESQKGRKATDETLKKLSKPVLQYDLEMNLISEYKSVKDAFEKTSIYMGKACLGLRKTAGGFIWKFKENNTK